MSAAGGGGFPPPFSGGSGAAPGGAPGFSQPGGFAPPQQQPAFAPPQQPAYGAPPTNPETFVLVIPPDPTWQPIDPSDTLENDGYFMARIAGEKVRNDDGKLQVIITLELLDPDVAGKKISKFMPDPRQTKGDTWWQWRSLMRSIGGSIAHGQQGFNYSPGSFANLNCFVKSGAYSDNKGTMRTGVEAWSTRDEWEEARKVPTRYRWPAKVHAAQSPGVGVLPGGVPAGMALPGAPGASLPGAPMAGLPGAPAAGVPQPGGSPMQQPAGQNPFAAPPVPPAATPPQQTAQNPFGGAPPAAQNPFAPPTGNGVPQPNAAGIAGAFVPPR